jgi:hypothetical protein
LMPNRDPATTGENHFQSSKRSRIRIPVRFDHLYCNQAATWLCSTFARLCFFRCRRSVLSAMPRSRQNSLHVNPLASNSTTITLTSHCFVVSASALLGFRSSRKFSTKTSAVQVRFDLEGGSLKDRQILDGRIGASLQKWPRDDDQDRQGY